MAAGPAGFLGQAWPPARTALIALPLAPPNPVDARKNFPLAGRGPGAAVIGTIIVLRDSRLCIITQMGLIGPGHMGLTSPVSPISPIDSISPIHAFHYCARGRRGSRGLFSTFPTPKLNVRPDAPIPRSVRSPTPASSVRPDARAPRPARWRRLWLRPVHLRLPPVHLRLPPVLSRRLSRPAS